MSDLVYTDYTEFCTQQNNVEKKGRKTGSNRIKSLKILIGILVLVVFVEIGIYSIVVPCSKPATVIFKGVSKSLASEFKNQLEQSCGHTWLNFNVGMASAIIASNSAVLDAKVEKKFPDKICITIQSREAVAVTLAELNGRTVPVQIDKKGVLFNKGSAVLSTHTPLLTGLPLEVATEGKRLNSLYIPLLEEIAKIQSNNPEYFSALSEIHISPKLYGDFELLMYPINSQNKGSHGS